MAARMAARSGRVCSRAGLVLDDVVDVVDLRLGYTVPNEVRRMGEVRAIIWRSAVGTCKRGEMYLPMKDRILWCRRSWSGRRGFLSTCHRYPAAMPVKHRKHSGTPPAIKLMPREPSATYLPGMENMPSKDRFMWGKWIENRAVRADDRG